MKDTMKNLQLLTFVLACSIGSVAVAKQGNMITIKNMNNQKYDRAVVKVWFIPFDNSGKTAQQGQKKQTHHVRTPRLGYLQLDMGSRKSATGNLYDATTHPCEYYVPGKRMAKKNIKNG